MKLFLTGGTGYLGLKLAAAFMAEGYDVTGLARSPEKAAPLAALGAQVAIGDVAEFDKAGIDLRPFDAVVHSAAMVQIRGDGPAAFDRVNVGGVAHLARHALDAGVKRFLYTSSFMALGPAPTPVPLDESVVHDPSHIHNDYERTKFLGLCEFDRWVKRGLPGVAVMPCVVFGPGSLTAGNLVSRSLGDLVLGRFPGLLGDGQTVWTYSYIDDVVRGHVAALAKGRPGEHYILGGDSATMQSFVELSARLADVKTPRRHIPFWVAKIAAFFEEMNSRLAHREPKLSRQVVEIYKHHWVYSSAKAARELGYTITPLEEGLAKTIAWVRGEIKEGRIE